MPLLLEGGSVIRGHVDEGALSQSTTCDSRYALVEQALKQIEDWAAEDENLRAAVVTGSVARGPPAMDALSDIDIELSSMSATCCLVRRHRMEFGEVLVVEALANPGWLPTRLVYYVAGRIDFVIAAVAALTKTVYAVPCSSCSSTRTVLLARHLSRQRTILKC